MIGQVLETGYITRKWLWW